MEWMYVAEQLAAEKHISLEKEARLARLAKAEGRPARKRAFAFKLWNVEVTVRTVRKYS